MNRILLIITWILRILTGATFVFSGVVKAIDPWGTLYKLIDYMDAMHLPVYRNLLLSGVFILCIYEFCVGVFLLLGCFRRSAPIMGIVFMAVMLPLTLWIALTDPVADCGCFGDALLLSNWTTFWKNVALTAAVVWLCKYNTLARCLVMPHLQWIVMISSAAYIIVTGSFGYFYQPLIDFRPYPVGSSLISYESSDIDEDAEYTLIYSKDGVEKEFGIDDLPSEEDGWEFVRRESPEAPTSSAGDEKNSATFRIWSEDGLDDVTDDILTPDGDMIILFMPDLASVSVATTWQINSLYSWANNHGMEMIGVVSGTPEQISEWKDVSLAAYPLYTAEDTEIKMIVRGNPAVVYLKDGKIVWKTTLRALGTEEFPTEENPKDDPASYSLDNRSVLNNVTSIYLILLAMLICFSALPALRRVFGSRRGQVSRDDRADHEESTHPDKPVQ